MNNSKERKNIMRLFLNSCNIAEIEQAKDWGHLGGITMNPSMVAKENYNFKSKIIDICSMVPDLPVWAQVVSENPEEILLEGKELASLSDNITVKVITNEKGIGGMKLLKQAGIPVCATCVHSVIEAIAAGAVGVDHIAVFVGLLGEVSEQPVSELLEKIVQVYRKGNISTKIMTAGRSISQIVDGYISGADESTCSFDLWKKFLQNNFTEDRWDAFISSWRGAYGDRNWITG